MHCSDTMEDLQVSLKRRFFLKTECESLTNRTVFSHAPRNAWKASSVGSWNPKDRVKQRSGSGVVSDFLTGLQIFDPSPGAMLTRNCESDFLSISSYPQTQCEGEAMQNGTRKSMVPHFSNSIIYEQASKQQAKYGPCTLVMVFFFI